MGLRLKFNIVLALVFAAGMAVSAYLSHQLLQNNAQEEVCATPDHDGGRARGARLHRLAGSPLIEYQLAEKFLPQSVPAYAASETFNTLRKKYPDFRTRRRC